MPIIGMTSFPDPETGVNRTNSTYVRAILAAGGTPVQLPVTPSEERAREMLSAVDGLLIPGGADINPLLFGEEPIPQIGNTWLDADRFEIFLCREAEKAGKPVFGICRGMQIMNVAFGGTLWQDIFAQGQALLCHRQGKAMRREKTHTVTLEDHTVLQELCGSREICVNSYHHQAVRDLAPGFRLSGLAKDGVIEAMESENGRMFAVQWHPEELQAEHKEAAALFERLIMLSR